MEQEPPRKRRRIRTLTDEDLATPAGVKLRSCLDQITSDGKVSANEAAELAEFLGRSDFDQTPAILALREFLRLALKDGEANDAILKQIYREVERILPPDLREAAQARREAAAALEAAERRAIIEDEREAAKLARLEQQRIVMRSAAAATYDFLVAGIRHYDFSEHMDIEGKAVLLAREPENKYDCNAVQVLLDEGTLLGYLPREEASTAAPLLDNGYVYRGVVKRIHRGRNGACPVVWLELFRPDTAATKTAIPIPPVTRMNHLRIAKPKEAETDQSDTLQGCGIGCLVLVLFVVLLKVSC